MIAISYRREDSSPVAGRLFDRLEAEFGKGNVFMDFDSIEYGVDFRAKIKQTLERAQVVIAIIGPAWMGHRGRGKRRIHEPADFVRLEIAQALARDIPVIPVLLDSTAMPKEESLPEEIRGLVYRHALVLDTGVDFHHHATRLIAALHKIVVLPPTIKAEPPPVVSADVEPRDRPPATPEKPRAAPNVPRRQLITVAAVAALGSITLWAGCSILFSINRAINEKRAMDSTKSPAPTPANAPSSPSSIATTFKTETPTPLPTPAFVSESLAAVPAAAVTGTATPTATATATATPEATATATPTPTATPELALEPTAAPVPTAARPASSEPGSVQEAEILVNTYYRAVERHDMDTLLSFFSSAVNFRTDTMRGKAAVQDDFERYFKRWPVASFTVGNIQIRRAKLPDNVIFVFNINFSVRDPVSKRSKVGRREETWTLERRGGELKIILQQEK
jgi:TIR domain